MRRSQRLSVTVDLAKRREEKAAKQLAHCRLILEEEQARLTELDSYYGEYVQQFKRLTTGLRASQLAAQRDFLEQLADTQNVQRAQIDKARRVLEEAKKVWLQEHLKHENLRDYVLRLESEEEKERDKKEQKAVDDWVNQTHGRNR